MEQERLIDINEMASILGVKRSWLYRRTWKKKIPYIKVGKYVRFDKKEVIEFLRKNTWPKKEN